MRISRTRNAIPVALTFAFVSLCAGEASAQRICELPENITGRTCSVERCIALQDEGVDRLCRTAPMTCRHSTDCEELKEIMGKLEECLIARVLIRNECFPSGPRTPGHNLEIASVIGRISKCEERIEEFCDEEPCP